MDRDLIDSRSILNTAISGRISNGQATQELDRNLRDNRASWQRVCLHDPLQEDSIAEADFAVLIG